MRNSLRACARAIASKKQLTQESTWRSLGYLPQMRGAKVYRYPHLFFKSTSWQGKKFLKSAQREISNIKSFDEY